MTRRAALVKVQIARRELAMADDAYRAMLERLTGQTSASTCTDAQLGVVLDELKAKGWVPTLVARGQKAPPSRPDASKALKQEATASRPIGPTRMADHAVARKARALWISLWQLGEVRDPSERALEAFAKRQLGVEKLQWADAGQGYRLIEALKAMAERAGWSQALLKRHAGREVLTLKHRLFEAQTLKLLARDGAAVLPAERPRTEADLDAAIAAAGAALRDGAEQP
jgi:Protein of unknown function (DUF1018).